MLESKEEVNQSLKINSSIQYSTINYGASNHRIKPKFFKLLSEIMSNHIDVSYHFQLIFIIMHSLF